MGAANPKRVMIFFRKEGFYPVEFTSKCTVEEHVRLNPGTLKVVDGISGEVVWSLFPPPAQGGR